MDNKTYRKYSSSLVASEFRSFGRNKMEDRKLALHNDGVNKNKEKRRKSFVNEKEQINKHFQENVSKTTPSLEQYLKRSQSKYNAWKLREQERLDRRYRGLYKSYLKEYSDLKLDESIAGLTGIRKLSTASDISDDVAAAKTDINDSEQQSSPDIFGVDGGATIDQIDGAENLDCVADKDEEIDKILAIGNVSLSKKRHQTSSVSDFPSNPFIDDDKRRFSTGGIIFQEEKKVRGLRAGKFDDMDMIKSKLVEISEDTSENEKGASNDVKTMKDALGENSSSDGRKKKTRRGSLPPKMPNAVVPMGTRLDRRSSLANVNIAVKYGN